MHAFYKINQAHSCLVVVSMLFLTVHDNTTNNKCKSNSNLYLLANTSNLPQSFCAYTSILTCTDQCKASFKRRTKENVSVSVEIIGDQQEKGKNKTSLLKNGKNDDDEVVEKQKAEP